MAEPLELVAIGCSHYEKGGRTCDFCYAHFKTPPFTGAHKPDCPVHLATGKLPCNHPAACDTGSGCGWCADLKKAEAVLDDIFMSVKHDPATEAKIEAYFDAKQEPKP